MSRRFWVLYDSVFFGWCIGWGVKNLLDGHNASAAFQFGAAAFFAAMFVWKLVEKDETRAAWDGMHRNKEHQGDFRNDVWVAYKESETIDRSVIEEHDRLLMAVSCYFEGESRFETALRYIQEAERAAVGTEADNKSAGNTLKVDQ